MKRQIMRGTALVTMLMTGGGGIFMAKQYIADDQAHAQVAPTETSAAIPSETGESGGAFSSTRLLNAMEDRTPVVTSVSDSTPTTARTEPRALAENARSPAAAPVDPMAGLARDLTPESNTSERAPNHVATETAAPVGRDPFGIRGADAVPAATPPRAVGEHPLRSTQPETQRPSQAKTQRPTPPESPRAITPQSNNVASAAPNSRYAAAPTGAAADPLGRYPAADEPANAAPLNRYSPPSAEPSQPLTEIAQPAPASLPSRDETLREPRNFSTNVAMPASHAAGPAKMPTSPQAGTTQLDGPQAPSVQVHKTAPAEIQVGKPAEFTILVKNVGAVAAHDVAVHDHVPSGTRLMSSEPRASELSDGAMQWQIGTLAPGEEKTLKLQLMPTAEGEIGSVASVSFRAEAGVRTIATKPELLLEIAAPSQVMIDTPVAFKIKISNPGSGEATGVAIFEDVPPQLSHPAGKELEFEIGNLKPGETREIELTLNAQVAGMVNNIVSVRGDANLQAQTEVQFEVIAPRLQVALQGPKLRYLEREATYQVSVANPGTAPAKEIELVSHLPEGMQFVSANNAGQYDKATHSVFWSLAELPQGEKGTVELVALPIEAGNQAIRIEGTADQGLSAKFEENVMVEGIAALFFGVADVADPIEVGGQSTYEIHVVNQGTKTAEAIRMVAQLPPGLRPLSVKGPTRGVIQGNQVIFEPLPRLAPKADTTYTIEFQGAVAGDQRVTVQVISADMTKPVTKEESTRVYTDR